MKRKTILIGFLCLWLLIFCTLFSAWNQEQMRLQVVLDSFSNGTNRVSLDCLNYDENGRHLYTVVEKTGWSSGLQAHEVSPENYQVKDTSLTLYDFGEPILYSSKPPQDGDDVRMVTSKQTEDTYLIVSADGTTETVEMPSAKSPFLQGQAKADLRAQGVTISETDTVYSLNEVKEFYANLPKLAAFGGILLTAILLWLCSFVLSKNAKRHKKILLLNAALMAAGLVVSAVLLRQINLPSSLLPQSNIFDFAHYREEFSELASVTMTNGK